jgi:hypothetical protein
VEGLAAGSPTRDGAVVSFPPPSHSPDDEDIARALHEASHAVAGVLLGRRVDRVVVDGDRGHAAIASMNTLNPLPDTITVEQVLEDVAVMLAGNEVNHVLRRAPSLIDEDKAHDLAHKSMPTIDEAVALVELGRMRARALVTSPVFVAIVQRVADELLAHGELDGDRVAAIVNDEGATTNGTA